MYHKEFIKIKQKNDLLIKSLLTWVRILFSHQGTKPGTIYLNPIVPKLTDANSWVWYELAPDTCALIVVIWNNLLKKEEYVKLW